MRSTVFTHPAEEHEFSPARHRPRSDGPHVDILISGLEVVVVRVVHSAEILCPDKVAQAAFPFRQGSDLWTPKQRRNVQHMYMSEFRWR